jgi:ATP-dependent DNA helicase RecQ
LEKKEMQALLKQYFGYDEFRSGQKQIIEQILSGKDVLAVMPTGAGKSICFQIPAMMMDGITIVISPLISLMKDQVDSLSQSGIKAAYINSSLSNLQLDRVISNAMSGMYSLIYVAPERLENSDFVALLKNLTVSMVAVDEAHCVSQWGHDFRPSYTKIADMVASLPHRPVIAAFTATATPQVKEDIIQLLKLNNPYTLTTGFDRENLYFEVAKPKNKMQALVQYLENNKGKCGIIYAATRKTVEMLCERLNEAGFPASRYHAGLSESERAQNQEDFLYDRVNIMAATNAFGMGIDKSNVSFVIHYNMPKNMESYYQEAGRAGRDGERAECILYFSASDIITNKFFIENNSENTDKSAEYQKLNEMVDYCNTDKCLRAYILHYFGDAEAREDENCGNCGSCKNETEETDITVEAQKIMSCIKRAGERFGSGVICSILRGRNTKKIAEMGFDQLSTYGIMKEYADSTIQELISFLIVEGSLDLSGDKYPILKLNLSSYEVLTGKRKVSIKRAIQKQQAISKEDTQTDTALFEILRELRKEIAGEENVPPYVVFSDVTLREMSGKYPTQNSEMLTIKGVGAHKLEKYGDRFLTVIQDYVEKNQITVDKSAFFIVEPEHHTKSAKSGTDTKRTSYDLYQSGLSITEIAEQRGLTQSTVKGHLLECCLQGMPMDVSAIVSEEQKKQIMDAIEQVGSDRLKPIKEALPEEISYSAIKFVLAKNELH